MLPQYDCPSVGVVEVFSNGVEWGWVGDEPTDSESGRYFTPWWIAKKIEPLETEAKHGLANQIITKTSKWATKWQQAHNWAFIFCARKVVLSDVFIKIRLLAKNHCNSGKWTDAEFQGSLTTRRSRIFLPITLEAKHGKIAKWSQHEPQWGFRSLGGDFELCRQSNVHRRLAIGGDLYRVRQLEPEQGTIQHATTWISQQISQAGKEPINVVTGPLHHYDNTLHHQYITLHYIHQHDTTLHLSLALDESNNPGPVAGFLHTVWETGSCIRLRELQEYGKWAS